MALIENQKWRAHAIALGLWSLPAVFALIVLEQESQGGWIDLGWLHHVIVLIAVLVPMLAIAVPTTVILALRRTGTATFAIALHAVTLLVVMLFIWAIRG